MLKAQPFDLVGVGHIVHEMIYFPDRVLGPVLGSPPAYSLVAAAQQDTRCGLVSQIGPDYPADLLAIFDRAGVDTAGVVRGSASTASHLIYDEQGNKEIRFPSRAAPIRAGDIPAAYRGCHMIYVCTMQDDVPLEELPQTARMGRYAAIDLGGYGGVHMSVARRKEIGDIEGFALEAAKHFDFAKASDEDCRAIFGHATPPQYGKRLLVGRVKASLITLGASGALVTTADGAWHVPPLDGKPIDATGGGDTFMGGLLAEYLRCGDVLQAAIFGSATALCVIEKTGGVTPERMPTQEQARRRIPQDIMTRVKQL
ncbi:MAG: carbohydrate kinase family protein [Verrucomicrobia bacterium]|nr:carbohydrate kinase family protein [Verrucomicrobiota bacterium]